MTLGDQILFFFSSLGVFNGLLIALYFLILLKPRNIKHSYFALLMLMLSIRIGKSVLYFFEPNLPKTILQIGLSACLFIGPFLFWYLRSVRNQWGIMRGNELRWLGIWIGVILAIGWKFPYETQPEAWNPYIVQGIYAIWLVYIFRSGYLLKDLIQSFFRNTQFLSHQEKWLLLVFGVNLLICLVFNSILYFNFPSYILGPITFSFVFYGLMAFLIFVPKSQQLIAGGPKSYNKKTIQAKQAEAIHQKLQSLMIEQRLYENPGLKLKDMAQALQISSHLLSQFLNQKLHKSFPDFVNEYRVQAAAKHLKSTHNLTIEGIGQEVGFRSKSSFYAAFKKQYGQTPLQYAKAANAS